MSPFTRNVRLQGVQVGELKIRRIGPSPLDMAKIAIIDDQYNPVSFSIFSAFSPRTRKAIEEAVRSIEEDYISYLSIDPQKDPNGETEEKEGEDEIAFG